MPYLCVALLLACLAAPFASSGAAFAQPGCRTDADCKAPRICWKGACQELVSSPCSRDADCPGEEVCEGARCTDRKPAAAPAAAEPEAPVGEEGTPFPFAGELAIGGTLQNWSPGQGFGWSWSAGLGVRFDSGVGLLALIGEGRTTLQPTASGASEVPAQVGHVGGGVTFMSRSGISTIGIAMATEGGLLNNKRGVALLFRNFYPIVSKFGISIEFLTAFIAERRVQTLSLGLAIGQ